MQHSTPTPQQRKKYYPEIWKTVTVRYTPFYYFQNFCCLDSKANTYYSDNICLQENVKPTSTGRQVWHTRLMGPWGTVLVLSCRFTTVPRSPNTPGSCTTPIPTINLTLLAKLQVSSLCSLQPFVCVCVCLPWRGALTAPINRDICR